MPKASIYIVKISTFVKYKLEDYVIGIIDVLKNNTSWNSYKIHEWQYLTKKTL